MRIISSVLHYWNNYAIQLSKMSPLTQTRLVMQIDQSLSGAAVLFEYLRQHDINTVSWTALIINPNKCDMSFDKLDKLLFIINFCCTFYNLGEDGHLARQENVG